MLQLFPSDLCTDIAITGKGTLVGNGQAWWYWKVLQQEAATGLIRAQINHMPVEKRVYGTERAALRPSFVQPINCRNVWLEDLTVEDGPQQTSYIYSGNHENFCQSELPIWYHIGICLFR